MKERNTEISTFDRMGEVWRKLLRNIQQDLRKIEEFEASANGEPAITLEDQILPPADPLELRGSLLKMKDEFSKPYNLHIS